MRESRGEEKLAIREFNKLLEAKAKELGFDADMLKRNVNEGFSGGEKKRNESAAARRARPEARRCWTRPTPASTSTR